MIIDKGNEMLKISRDDKKIQLTIFDSSGIHLIEIDPPDCQVVANSIIGHGKEAENYDDLPF